MLPPISYKQLLSTTPQFLPPFKIMKYTKKWVPESTFVFSPTYYWYVRLVNSHSSLDPWRANIHEMGEHNGIKTILKEHLGIWEYVKCWPILTFWTAILSTAENHQLTSQLHCKFQLGKVVSEKTFYYWQTCKSCMILINVAI